MVIEKFKCKLTDASTIQERLFSASKAARKKRKQAAEDKACFVAKVTAVVESEGETAREDGMQDVDVEEDHGEVGKGGKGAVEEDSMEQEEASVVRLAAAASSVAANGKGLAQAAIQQGDVQKQTERLKVVKGLYEQGLIDETIYQEKQREILASI